MKQSNISAVATDQTTIAEICRAVAKDLKRRGYTQAQAAELMNIHPKSVANQISGKRAFGKKAAHIYAKAFGYSEAYLLHGEGSLLETPKEETPATEAVILTLAQYKELIRRITSLEQSVANLGNPDAARIGASTPHVSAKPKRVVYKMRAKARATAKAAHVVAVNGTPVRIVGNPCMEAESE